MSDRLKLIWIIAFWSTLIFASRLTPSDFWPYVPETDYVPRLFELLEEAWKITMSAYGQ